MISTSFFRKTIFALASLIILLSSACKPKEVIIAPIENTELSPSQVMDQVIQNQFAADWLNAKCQISFDNGDMAVSGSATIKMHKDDFIWMNVKKFGFEVARAMITEDSVFVLDRINNEYAAEPLSYIEKNFRLPANLGMLQQILLGNPVFLTTENLKADFQNDEYRLSAESNGQRNDFWFGMPDYSLQKMSMDEPTENRSLNIDLAKYGDAAGNREFSYLRNISMQSRETGQATVALEFNQVEINVPFEVKFSIPSRYTRSSR